MSGINRKGVILLLSGKVRTLSQLHSFDEDEYDIHKIDEKDLINFKFLLNLVKHRGYNELLVGILNYDNQRFLFFLNLVSVISLIKKPYIIDEKGLKLKFGMIRFMFSSLPVFLLGLMYASIIAPSYLFIFKILKWKYLKTN